VEVTVAFGEIKS